MLIVWPRIEQDNFYWGFYSNGNIWMGLLVVAALRGV